MVTDNSSLDGRPDFSPSHWNKNFRIFYLTEKMRSQADPFFSDLCDRVGRGNLTENDEEYLRSRIKFNDSENANENFKSGKLSIIVTTNSKKDLINHQKLNSLLPEEQEYSCNSIDRVTNLPVGNLLPEKLKVNPGKTGNLQTELKLKVGAPIVITTNHSKQKYREDGLVNGARGYVHAIQTNKDNKNQVEVIWIVFNNENVGNLYRFEHKHLRQDFNPGHEKATPLLPVRRNFKATFGNVEYQRQNFALSLAYAITAHKCQGETLEEVVIDFGPDLKNKIKNYICPGSFYVALTRVREGKKVFLKSFDRSYIQVNTKIEEKINSMIKHRSYIFKKVYLDDKVFKIDEKEIRVGYLNINGLLDGGHAQYLNADKNLSNLDILVLAETKLDVNCSAQKIENYLDNWNILARYDSKDERKHMGLLLLSGKKSKLPTQVENICHKTAKRNGQNQIEGLIVRISNGLTFGFIYCRSTPTELEIVSINRYFIDCNVFMGDLNLSHRIQNDQQKIVSLCQETKVNVLKEITRSVSWNQLDYILVDKSLTDNCLATSFSNFISDHNSITVRIGLDQNNLTDEIKQKINFNQESHLKPTAIDDQDDTLRSKREDHGTDQSLSSDSSEYQSDVQINELEQISRESDPHFRRNFINPDLATCWLNSCLQMVLAAIDHSNPPIHFTSELGIELLKLQNSKENRLDPTTAKDIIVTTENTRIAIQLSELQNDIVDKEQLEGRSRLIEARRIDLESGQQDVQDFFFCLQMNAQSWTDVYMCFAFSITHSVTCCNCGQVQSYETRTLFDEVDLPFRTAKLNLKDLVEEHFHMSSSVMVFCEDCKKLVQKERASKLTSVGNTEFLAIILKRAVETLDGSRLLDSEVIPTNDVLIR